MFRVESQLFRFSFSHLLWIAWLFTGCSGISYHSVKSGPAPLIEPMKSRMTVFLQTENEKEQNNSVTELVEPFDSRLKARDQDFRVVSDKEQADYIFTLSRYQRNSGWSFQEDGDCSFSSGNVDLFVNMFVPNPHTTCRFGIDLKVRKRACPEDDEVWVRNVKYEYFFLPLVPLWPFNELIQWVLRDSNDVKLSQSIDGAFDQILANRGHYEKCEYSISEGNHTLWVSSADTYLPLCDINHESYFQDKFQFQRVSADEGLMIAPAGEGFHCTDKAWNLWYPTCEAACKGLAQKGNCKTEKAFRCRIPKDKR